MANLPLFSSVFRPSYTPTGTTRLSQDMTTLVNNRQGSDIQFKVGGSTLEVNGDIIYGESIVTIYAHSLILRCRSRYFTAMLDEDKQWKEHSNTVIYKPNISPSTFEDVLYYIYTGTVRITNLEKIVELIAAADEMDLEELKVECQTKLVETIKYSLTGKIAVGSLPFIVSTLIVSALDLNGHSFSHLSWGLLKVLLPNMSAIIESPDAYIAFINGISSKALVKIISSDDLVMTERSIWDLALSWACQRMKLSKTTVETCLTNYEDDEEEKEVEKKEEKEKKKEEEEEIEHDLANNLEEFALEKPSNVSISTTQLKQLKTILAPLLPCIRFCLLEPKDYMHMVDILTYFLSRRQSSELQRFFIDRSFLPLDSPRKKTKKDQARYSEITEIEARKGPNGLTRRYGYEIQKRLSTTK